MCCTTYHKVQSDPLTIYLMRDPSSFIHNSYTCDSSSDEAFLESELGERKEGSIKAEKNRINRYLETCVVALKGSNRGSSRQVSRMHRISTGIPGWRSVIAEARTVCQIQVIPVVFDKLIATFLFFLNRGLGITYYAKRWGACGVVGLLR